MDEKFKILVVDDRPENLLAMESLLENDQISVVTANSGNEALGLVIKNDFSVILLDVQMPEMNGFETAELLRSNSKTKRIPIIFVSAISKEQHHIFRGYESGAVDYLFKPIQPQILKSKVTVFIQLHQQRKKIESTVEELKSTIDELKRSEKALKEKEEQLRQKQKMEAIGRLAGGIAHEINNPLSFVLSHMRRTLRDVQTWSKRAKADENGEESIRIDTRELGNLKDRVTTVIEGCQRVNAIVKDLTRFAKLNDEEHHAVKLNKVLEKVVSLAAFDIKNKAQLIQKLEPIPPLESNEGRMFQVFLNLVMNAIHAIEEGTPEENQISLHTWSQDGEIIAEISDTGIGIEKSNLSRIFDPFFTTKPTGQGTGLGLSACHGIVEAHGGYIEVKSELNKGSKFIVHLPY